MSVRPLRRSLPAVAAGLVLALAAAGCSDEPEVVNEVAEVTAAEVVATVAAPARIAPRDRVTVSAPVGGEVVELLVADGDVVEAGDPIARLASDSLELQIAQAEQAVEAADALSRVSVGLDLSPLITAVRGQLETVVPDVLDAVEGQLGAVQDPDQRAQAEQALTRARQSYLESTAELRNAEARARSQANRASASQRAAAEAQREAAELALDAAEERRDDLVVTAPVGGVVELAPAAGAGGGGVPDVSALAEGAGGGDLSGLAAGLLGGGGSGTSSSGPIAVGVDLAPGQAVATVFDLGAFYADVQVDELDAVQVARGQEVTVLVDAYPDAVLMGTVTHVAIEPTRGETGGVVFPVQVDITDVPDGVELRVGLTASAEVVVDRVDADTVVPSSALLRRGGQEVVYVVGDDDVVREVEVTVLAFGDDDAAVEGDLAVGDRVVVSGVAELTDGATIVPSPFPVDTPTP
ncbi:MAG: efflux RND transporter periplasmic adaptor subunit [Actinomycetes bacterium]